MRMYPGHPDNEKTFKATAKINGADVEVFTMRGVPNVWFRVNNQTFEVMVGTQKRWMARMLTKAMRKLDGQQ